ncbi:ABC transporter substrate-binding protein [Paenibacillus beijingensis]|uniref:Sugar ABC transporter substrate-binding protein n=1 Tax=Paenibacillus beijingensis TaxID=1126833 RepID=A0A0D5NG04_9BACL|nr:sugar ABC transporter substrate-binding protein [Paenibacillus beijingensis]AJY74075.1 sugar ABC transporter substrate-binding protein [Paenibacillus beijingensis]
MGRGKVKSLLVGTLGTLILVTSACGNSGGDNTSESTGEGGQSAAKQVTLQFWTISLQPKFNDFFNGLIDKYEQSHPGVTVDWKDYPYDAIQSKLLATAAGGDAPDVVNLNTEFANQLATKGALADLTSLVGDDVKSSFFDGIFNSTVFDGKPYALPWYTGTQVLYMNKSLLQKAGLDPANPPKTKEELYDWSRQIKAKAGAAGFATQFAANLFPSEGVPILDADRQKAAFDSEDGIAAVAELKKLVDEGVILKDDANFDKQIQYYSSEQVAFELSGPSFINFLKTAAPDVYNNTVAVPLPTGKGDLRYSNSMNVVVPKGSKNPQQAAEFAAFITNAENQTAFSKDSNTLPSTKESIKDPFFSQSDNTLESQAKIASAQSLDKAQEYFLGVPMASDINSAIARELQKIMLDGGDVKAGVDSAANQVNDIIASGS